MKQGAALLFAHGFNVHFKLIEPRKDLDVLMVAPKGPGIRCAANISRAGGVPSLIAVHQDASGNAHDLGAFLRLGHRRWPCGRDRDQLPGRMRKRICSANSRCFAADWSN